MWIKAASLLSQTIREADLTRKATFIFGPSGASLYPTTGSSNDYVYAIGKAKFSYTIELPDQASVGFCYRMIELSLWQQSSK